MELVLGQEEFIVSKTDTKGYITYCNQVFMKFAGYASNDLIGQNHNIIRHQDMPKVAFQLAWEHIQANKEFFGFVKNRSKNGDYYWVFAHITPDYDNAGRIIGFTSFRREPNRKAIATVEGLYQELLKIEKNSGLSASRAYLDKFLSDNNTYYNKLILQLQNQG